MIITGAVTKVTRMFNTVNGTPRYRFTMDDGQEFTTYKDAMFNYEIVDTRVEGKRVSLDIGRRGQIEGYDLI